MHTVTVTLVPGHKYQQEVSARTHTVISDVETSVGGADGGPDPKELLLGALGSCTAMTILMVQARKNWDIQSLTIKVTEDEQPDPSDSTKKIPVFTEEIEVKGNLSAKELADIKAVALKCPVYKLLTQPKLTVANITLLP